jgi:hypothetical protein
VREVQASIWLPVVAGRDHGAVFVAERLCLALPYVLVDNPMSYLGGREDYGYAKTMARFAPEEGIGEQIRVDAYGGNFGRNQRAGWHPLLEVAPATAGDDAPGGAWEEPADLVRYLARGLLDEHPGGELTLPDARLGAQLVAEMLSGRARQVFLKQFRDAAEGTRACYQSVVEAPFQVTRVSCRPSLRDWEVTVHSLDSHPVARELGVRSQVASLSFDLEIDFVVENGAEVAPAVARAGAPPAPVSDGAAPPSEEGLLVLIESAVSRLYRELSALGRRRWW